MSEIFDAKQKIREKYKGIDPDELFVIPALPEVSLYDKNGRKRVAAYVRVSTDDISQTTSFELQKNHYLDYISKHENWELVKIYADEGISGTSLEHRDAFNEMINDCKEGKIDIIITKSVSRFARNTLDCISHVRTLRELNPPVGVKFESEGLFTLDPHTELILTMLASYAQEESQNKSDIMNASIEMRFKKGIFLTPPLLGYDQDEDGNLVINQEEAKTVQLIFYMYLDGHSCQEIADLLTRYNRKTKKGNITWSPSSILKILQNERHCGDIWARKTWTPNFLNHKSKKNNQNRNKYFQGNHHEAIISRDDFMAVQELIKNARYKNSDFLPELRVITEGILKGYVCIKPKWAGFKSEDYIEASRSTYSEMELLKAKKEVSVKKGEFDLRDFQKVRWPYTNEESVAIASFSMDGILFNTSSINQLKKTLFVEMLINSETQTFAIRPCSEKDKNCIKWAKQKNDIISPRKVSCKAFISVIYEILGWNKECKYKVRGIKKQKNDETLLIFDLKEPVILIPRKTTFAADINLLDNTQILTAGPKKDIIAYPESWKDSFGDNFYKHNNDVNPEFWNAKDEGQKFKDSGELEKITSPDDARKNIETIIRDLNQGEKTSGE